MKQDAWIVTTLLAACAAALLTARVRNEQAAQPDSAWIARHVRVIFDSLPGEWVAERNVMDGIWRPLGLEGVNDYAYGGRAAGQTFAARSDPSSPLYQAWIGAYLVADSAAAEPGVPMRLARLDQEAWLGAMGDPSPSFQLLASRPSGTIAVAGAAHPLYVFEGATHSDLGPGTTPLAAHVGMPPPAGRPRGLAAFHNLTLRGYFTYWYDPRRRLTVIVYGCAAAWEWAGVRHDNLPILGPSLLATMRNIRLRDST